MSTSQFLYSQRALIVRMCEAVGIDRSHMAGVSDEEWAASADSAIRLATSQRDTLLAIATALGVALQTEVEITRDAS